MLSLQEKFQNIEIQIGNRRGQFKTKCPRCHFDRTNKADLSLSVNTSTQEFNCHHCGWQGNVRDDFQKAKDKKIMNPLPKIYPKIKYESKSLAPDAEYLPSSTAFFETRGISKKILRYFNINERTISRKKRDEQGNIVYVDKKPILEDITTICFPYYKYKENGSLEVVNIKYRGIDTKRFALEPNAEMIFYNHKSLKYAKTMVIVEGEIDCLACAESLWVDDVGTIDGDIGVVSVPNGAPSPNSTNFSKHFQYLDNLQENIKNIEKVVIFVDNDAPGVKLKEELIRRLSAMIGIEKIYTAKTCECCKDANDVLKNHGAKELKDRLENPIAVPVIGYVEAEEIFDDIDLAYSQGIQMGASTGWSSLEGKLHLSPGRLMIVTGHPGHGKTTWVFSLLTNIAMQYGWFSAICSPETRPVRRIGIEIIKRYIGKPFYSGTFSKMDEEEKEMGKEFFAQNFGIIAHKEPPTIDQFLDTARTFVARKGAKVIVADPFNEFNLGDMNGMSETNYIGYVLTKCRNFAELYQCLMIIIVHPTKMAKIDKNRYPVATLGDCVGSYNWKAKADIGVSVHRDIMNTPNIAEIYIQKARNEEDGKISMAYLNFDLVTGRFYDLDKAQLKNLLVRKQEIESKRRNRSDNVEIYLDNAKSSTGGQNQQNRILDLSMIDITTGQSIEANPDQVEEIQQVTNQDDNVDDGNWDLFS